MSRVWFTADQHFRHGNIVDFCGRPWKSVQEHDEGLTDAWNSRVSKGDRVYVLGDFCWHGEPSAILDRLHGQLYLIRGNHDFRAVCRHPRWLWCKGWKGIEIEGQHIVMCHFPWVTWPGNRRGRWMLHGHVHSGLGHDKPDAVPGRFDVGVDGHPDYAPWSFEELVDRVPKEDKCER